MNSLKSECVNNAEYFKLFYFKRRISNYQRLPVRIEILSSSENGHEGQEDVHNGCEYTLSVLLFLFSGDIFRDFIFLHIDAILLQ